MLSVVLPYGKILQSQEGKNLAETLNCDLIPGSWSMLLLTQAAIVPHHPAILGRRRLSSLSGLVHQPRSPLLQELVRMCLNPSFHLKLLLPEPHTSGSPSIPEPEGKQMSWGGRSRHIQQEISGPRRSS